jgi:hypothetical protein
MIVSSFVSWIVTDTDDFSSPSSLGFVRDWSELETVSALKQKYSLFSSCLMKLILRISDSHE